MTIDVGHTLGKYELRERVGQGGMAVVYRGLDKSLRREVAVKVLHRHLAESDEARDRFEREAQAVAKLRHENILEIFDFSGTGSEESYIVTEFIDGQTLKEFIGEHEIPYPEIGAMIALQVCRALVHAHGFGVLHRDVKPENIMIRNDGVVKLMDFGIAQMLDLQRMTVTGQLLGSPAYMSPEHVEGKRLDFRTDVFAVGIVLYQLITGELPFQGKNPHEILKKIAECKYVAPEVTNPLVGKELGRIVRKALTRRKDDRYADVSQMLTALEEYLEGSGLKGYTEELARFFEAPASYAMALRPRLVDHLSRRGRKMLEEDRVKALEIYNRVLTLDPENRSVLEDIDRLSRRRRWTKVTALLAAIVVLGAGAAFARELLQEEARANKAVVLGGQDLDAAAEPSPALDAGVEALSAVPDATALAGAADAAVDENRTNGNRTDGNRTNGNRTDGNRTDGNRTNGNRTNGRRRRPDAGPPALPPREFVLSVSPKGSEYRIGDGPWQSMSGRTTRVSVSPGGPVRVSARNPSCCAPKSRTLDEEELGDRVSLSLDFLPATVVAECEVEGVRVHVDGKPWHLGRPGMTIPLQKTALGTKKVTVKFFDESRPFSDERTVRVRYNQTFTVECRP